MTSSPNRPEPGWRRRLSSFFRGWECHGWHAACPTIRSERRRATSGAPRAGSAGTDGAVRTDRFQSG